jgi:hypothetical protein
MHPIATEPGKRALAALSRREFLSAGATAAVTLASSRESGAAESATPRATRCIFLILTGGPSHLDTFDPKPDAPAEVRGPFGSVATRVGGIRIGEHMPCLAAQAHRWALIRSVHHRATAIHETGLQLLQTGRLTGHQLEHPHVGAVLAHRFGRRQPGVPSFAIVPARLGNTGMNLAHGQNAGFLGAAYDPVVVPAPPTTPDRLRDHYGATEFGDHCRHACRLVEAGVRCVVVNMFETVYDQVTWDCHADRRLLGSTLDDYRRVVCPTFDRACAALLEDLHQRGLLDSTLVVAAGEFGRTPRLNAMGGRDHWPGVWSVLLTGGGVRGGQVIGASDKHGTEPDRRPVQAADIAATIYHAFGVDPATCLTGPKAEKIALTEGRPVAEVFG